LSRKTAALLIALGLSVSVFAQQSVPLASARKSQAAESPASVKVVSATATVTQGGVLVEWRTSYELNTAGFYLYRESAGRRARVSESIVPGSALMLGDGVPLREGYGYSAFDPAGTPNAKYYLESIDLRGAITQHGAITVLNAQVRKGLPPGFKDEMHASGEDFSLNGGQTSQLSWPASLANQTQTAGSMQDQWVIAGQPGLKIGVRADGWYRLTQSQLVSAGLDPATDARNLRMFVDSHEVAIRVSRESGQLLPSDFVEFYGAGLDVPWSDQQIYWLTGGTQAGKRIPIFGDVNHDRAPVIRPKTLPVKPPAPAPTVNEGFINLPGEALMRRSEPTHTPAAPRLELKPANESVATDVIGGSSDTSDNSIASEAPASSTAKENSAPKSTPAAAPTSKPLATAGPAAKPAPTSTRKAVSRKRKHTRRTRRAGHRRMVKRNHAELTSTPASSFLQTVSKQERTNYFSALQNGEAENFFGQVLVTPNATTQTLSLTNIDATAPVPAQLEIALQGIAFPASYSVFFNDLLVGTMSVFFRDHTITSFPIPLNLLREGGNDIKFVPQAGSGITFVDYVRLTYPRSYRAVNNSLRFSTRFNQAVTVDGFTSTGVRVLDITDATQIEEVRPIVENSASGYALTIPAVGAKTKGLRTLLVLPDGQFQQPATITSNSPSTLNATSNGADLVVIAHANFMASADPLVALRIGEGLAVAKIDVENIYDEFGYGRHTPYALKEFFSWAANNWTKPPQYIILLGDASVDPRNYQGFGNFDFVPTKIIDTPFLETASDDWLADFDEDGNAEIAIGRMPARTVAEANTIISKVVNFHPATVPQSALLVADAQGSYYFDFEEANSAVAALLPPSMTVQTVNRRTEPSDAAAKANIIAKFNAGQALVNYSGHGNINAWAGSILTSDDALALTNGNDKLPFVVVLDCLNGYFVEPRPLGEGLAESFLKAPNGGAVASFASSGETFPEGQHFMSQSLLQLLYNGPPMRLGDAIKQAKAEPTVDLDVRRTWIFFGDPTMKIR